MTNSPAARSIQWSVTVSRDGEEIVAIESNCLSGREVDEADERAIRQVVVNLLGFSGPTSGV